MRAISQAIGMKVIQEKWRAAVVICAILPVAACGVGPRGLPNMNEEAGQQRAPIVSPFAAGFFSTPYERPFPSSPWGVTVTRSRQNSAVLQVEPGENQYRLRRDPNSRYFAPYPYYYQPNSWLLPQSNELQSGSELEAPPSKEPKTPIRRDHLSFRLSPDFRRYSVG